MMTPRNFIAPLALAVLIFLAWRSWGWAGVLAGAGAGLLWLLLHFNRLMSVMRKAADQPVGSVQSAVMLNARLKPGVNLLHVVAMTKALGEQLSGEGEQPEVYRWRDGGDSHVTCEFEGGRLKRWMLQRPAQDGAGAGPSGQS